MSSKGEAPRARNVEIFGSRAAGSPWAPLEGRSQVGPFRQQAAIR